MTTRHWLLVLALAALVSAAAASAEDERDKAPRLALGETVQVSLPTTETEVRFKLAIDKRGPFRLSVVPEGTGADLFHVQLLSGERLLHGYHGANGFARLQFFPVLEKGDYTLQVGGGNDALKGAKLTLERFEPVLTDDDRKAARAAIDKACAFLEKDRPEDQSTVGIEGLVLAALCEKASPERRARLDEGLVGFFEGKMTETAGTWKGEHVATPVEPIYEASIVTLGLAEAAANGSARAKALLPRCVKYLLAAQLGPLRCKEWVPVAASSPHAGGWRYSPNSEDADVSASGWCLVALIAASAAGVEVDGLRDGVHAGVDYILHCASPTGFNYVAGSNDGPTDVRSGIGALVCLLSGEEPSCLPAVLDQLDDRLPAYSQVEAGQEYPLYYAYYGTRVNYLRRGFPWQVWRTATVRQLLAGQQPDGSFLRGAEEAGLTDRYGTALGVMILRICLEEVPAYLKLEVRGF